MHNDQLVAALDPADIGVFAQLDRACSTGRKKAARPPIRQGVLDKPIQTDIAGRGHSLQDHLARILKALLCMSGGMGTYYLDDVGVG